MDNALRQDQMGSGLRESFKMANAKVTVSIRGLKEPWLKASLKMVIHVVNALELNPMELKSQEYLMAGFSMAKEFKLIQQE